MIETKGFSSKDDIKSDEKEFLAQLQNWHDYAKRNRQVFDWNWYLYANYHKGNHYVQFNRTTKQLVTPPRPKGQVRLVVNKIYSVTRAILNFATSYRPKWFVVADSTNEEEVNSGQKSGDTLDNYYDRLNIARLFKMATRWTINYGISFFQYGWDDEAGDDGQGDCVVWTRDPFDVYLDPAGMETGDIQNCRFIDIAVSVPIQNIIDNPNYKKLSYDDISTDTKRASSEFKSILIQNQYVTSNSESKELGNVILHETMYKKRVKVKAEAMAEGETNESYESKVYIASWIEGHQLRDEETEFSKYNLIAYPSDDNPGEIYGEGYIKNLIPVNKILNRLESQVVEYNNIINRGRIIADKNAGLSKITNETGEILEKNAGTDVHYANPGGLAPDMPSQIARMSQYTDDISGVQQAFRGDTPAGVTSGTALESLRAQSANNLQDLKDNGERALAELGEGILEFLSAKLVTSRTMKRNGKDGKPESFKIKGQVGVEANEELQPDTYVIGAKNKVKVVIGSDLAYTREGRIALLDKLLQNKAIDQQTYPEHLEFGDVENIVKRTQQDQFDQAMLANVQKNGMPGAMGQPPMAPQGAPAGAPQAGAAPQGQQPPQDSWAKLADDENHAMLGGKVLPPTPNAPKEHTAVHIAWSQSPEVQENDHLMKELYKHISGEEQAAGAPHAGQNMPSQGAGDQQQPAAAPVEAPAQ